MATLYDAKPRFQVLLRPLVARLPARGITANAVTLGALVLSLGWGASCAWSDGDAAVLLALPLVLLVRMALNATDGMLAREHRQASALGGRLNEVCDVLSDLAIGLPFALVLAPAWPVVLLLALAAVAEVAGLAAQAHGGPRRYDGPLGKSDRALLFAAVAVGQAAWGLDPLVVAIVFGAASAAAAVTIVNRLLGGLRHG